MCSRDLRLFSAHLKTVGAMTTIVRPTYSVPLLALQKDASVVLHTYSMHNNRQLDTQIVELIGRHALIEEILASGLEVAIPIRDHGVDLIVFTDMATTFGAVPIQLKAATGKCFSIDLRYSRFPNLLLVFVWNVSSPNRRFYALSLKEATTLAELLGFAATESWRKGKYVVTSPSKKLERLLEPFQMGRADWRAKLLGLHS